MNSKLFGVLLVFLINFVCYNEASNVWPMPSSLTRGITTLAIDPESFEINTDSSSVQYTTNFFFVNNYSFIS